VEETHISHGEATPTFLEQEDCSTTESLPEIERKIYSWLDEKNILLANPKEKLYSYFQKNRDRILFGKLKKTNPTIPEQLKLESKPFLNFNNSPLLARREKKINK